MAKPAAYMQHITRHEISVLGASGIVLSLTSATAKAASAIPAQNGARDRQSGCQSPSLLRGLPGMPALESSHYPRYPKMA